MKHIQAVVLLIVLSVIIFPVSLRAQETTFISNVAGSTSVSYTVCNSEYFALQFSTGSNPAGYLLDAVGMDLAGAEVNGEGGFQVSIYSDNGNSPGTLVQILNGPDDPEASGVTNYTASNLTLSPSTKYWVVASGANFF